MNMKHLIAHQNDDSIARHILILRDRRVMIDKDLAPLYGVTTGNLNKAVTRNRKRFPEDFMFRLTKAEAESLRFQSGSLKRGQHFKYLPYAFTEQGVSMLSAVLNSPKAIDISIKIMRAFVRLRLMMVQNEAVRIAIEGLEKRTDKNERDIQLALSFLKEILFPPEKEIPEKPYRLGFEPPPKK
jgi:hypothetical protein